jgi:hypothetical protein
LHFELIMRFAASKAIIESFYSSVQVVPIWHSQSIYLGIY